MNFSMLRYLIVLLISFAYQAAYAQYMTPEEVFKDAHQQQSAKSFTPSKKFKENMAKIKSADLVKPKKHKTKFAKRIQAAPLPLNVDLRRLDSPVKSQEDGHCTAYSLTAIMEHLIQRKHGILPSLDLSDEHMFSLYNVYQMDVAINKMAKSKICDEIYYTQRGPKTSKCVPTAHAGLVTFDEIDQGSVQAALAATNPVYFGLAVPRGMANCDKTIPATSSVTSGGHAVEIAGYLTDTKTGEGYYIIKNSWGDDCGDKGYQYLASSYCKKTWCYFYEVDSVKSRYDDILPTPVPTVTVVPTVAPTATAVPTPVPAECKCVADRCNWWTLCIKKICTKTEPAGCRL